MEDQEPEEEWEPQFYPGGDGISERRRQLWNKETDLSKYRDIADDDITRILGQRPVGAQYPSIHPPLEELIESYDPIKDIVTPTPGARAGDRIRYAQFSDSFWYPPITPYARQRLYFNRFRGVDTVTYSGRCMLEMRERDLETVMNDLLETDVFDPARTTLKGITIHGHSLRLDENGLMFDARRRFVLNEENNEVYYIKDQMGNVLDQPVPVGAPFTEDEARKHSVSYFWDTRQYKSRTELLRVTSRASNMRVLAGFNPELIDFQT